MVRDIQPDNFFLNFTNVNTLPGNNDLEYYYREGEIWATGTENIFEPKVLNLSQSDISRTTLIKSVSDPIIDGGMFITPEGESIPHGVNDEIYVSSNYFGTQNMSRDYNSKEWQNSWWYDTKAHRAYRVYVVLSYTEITHIAGESFYDWSINMAHIVYKDSL